MILKCNLSEPQKKKEFEWVNWDIVESFKYKTRDYVMIQKWNVRKNKHDRYICYKSQSGMLWHLLLYDWTPGSKKYLKFDNCGLYTTSLLIDLNLQKEFCKQQILTEIDDDTFASKVDITNNNSRFHRQDKDLADSDSDDSYIQSIEKNSLLCKKGPYLIFKKILNSLKIDEYLLYDEHNPDAKEYHVPDCGKSYSGSLWHSSLIYSEIRKQINEKMAENFIDLGNEEELYSCHSGKIGIIYIGYKFVKTFYTIFRREIQPTYFYEQGTGRNKFILIYAKYNFIEDVTDGITLPSEKFRGRQFIIPLFITSQDNKQFNYPLINKIAATGLYSCKAFEYKFQSIGSYNYRYTEDGEEYEKMSEEEKESSLENSRIEGNGQYYFIGEFMDKMWPFEGWHKELPYTHYIPEGPLVPPPAQGCVIS